jgi:V8-like Glu-specific endopeptidase
MDDRSDLMRQLNLDLLAESDADSIMNRAFMAEEPRLRARALSFEAPGIEESVPGAPPEELPDPDMAYRRGAVEAGLRAAEKVRVEGLDAELSEAEQFGLEAIVLLEGRPALLIQNGAFFPPPPAWRDILEPERTTIEGNFTSVGRIELTGHPSYAWVGTGFLVARDVIMTNRHVAKVFCRMERYRKWGFEPGMSASIDYVEEFGSVDTAEFALTRVIGVHDVYDLALFKAERVSSSTGAKAPEPLTIAAQGPSPAKDRTVYVVGYPAWDGRRNDPEPMRKIFSNIFDVKRMQPGKTITDVNIQNNTFRHDCSTLGGNSGSCVIDLETNQVLGLHFGGKYLQGNHAVALWQLVSDPLLKRGKVQFD